MDWRGVAGKALKAIVVLVLVGVAATLWGLVAGAFRASGTLIWLGGLAIAAGILMRAYGGDAKSGGSRNAPPKSQASLSTNPTGTTRSNNKDRDPLLRKRETIEPNEIAKLVGIFQNRLRAISIGELYNLDDLRPKDRFRCFVVDTALVWTMIALHRKRLVTAALFWG